jgi:hypothetical protein
MLRASEPPPDRERDAMIVAHFVVLIHARSKGDYLKAADTHRELERLGVAVRFPRRRKGVADGK